MEDWIWLTQKHLKELPLRPHWAILQPKIRRLQAFYYGDDGGGGVVSLQYRLECRGRTPTSSDQCLGAWGLGLQRFSVLGFRVLGFR